MFKFKKIISLVIAVLMLLACSSCTKINIESFSQDLSLTPLAAGKDILLSYNPDRGFRSACSINVGELASLGNESQIRTKAYSVLNNYVFSLLDNTEVVNILYNISAYNKKDTLPNEALSVIKTVFEILRDKGYKQSINFVYNNTYHVSYLNGVTARNNIESVSASEDVILSHIDGLAPLVSEYKDTVFSIMGGFIGFSGDMADSTQYPPVNRIKVMKKVIEKLVVPNDVYYLIRDPQYKYDLEVDSPDYPYLDRISFVNKAMFGEQTKQGWHSGGYQKGNPENKRLDAWEYVTVQAPYAPNDAELFPNSNLIGKGSYPVARIVSGLEAILECSHHGMTTMGFWNGYYEVNRATQSPAVMDLWKTEKITEKILQDNNIVYDPAWFKNSDGTEAKRNCFEFIRDHLGYKIVAHSGRVEGNTDSIKAELTLKNYGFSAAFNLESGFAILDSEFKEISHIAVGEPDKWYSHNPDSINSTKVPEYTINAALEAPKEKGKYYIAFYLKNTMGEGAVLSNSEMQFEDGYNILYEFEAK